MRYSIILLVTLVMALAITQLPAKDSNSLDDLLSSPKRDSINNDIIRVNYAKKDARLAMLLSAILPGAGQFYANKSAITTYIFPIIEVAVIGGMVYYDNQGDKKTKVYKKYATETIDQDIYSFTDAGTVIYHYTGPRYNREFQYATQENLKDIHSNDIYDGDYFILDSDNSQHFYEDIGKYDKYIFGWADWYANYADSTMLPFTEWPNTGNDNFNPNFAFEITDPLNQNYNSYANTWLGNYHLGSDLTSYDLPYSEFRNKYIKMRQDAEDEYRGVHYLSFGIALNHIASAIDAVFGANKVNRFYLSENKIKFNYYAALKEGHLTPMIGLNLSF
jgi:hypothetical protein